MGKPKSETKVIDLAESNPRLTELLENSGRVAVPVDIRMGNEVVARLIPPPDLNDEEREAVLRKGREFMQKARAHSRRQGFSEKEIARDVDAAVKQVRSSK